VCVVVKVRLPSNFLLTFMFEWPHSFVVSRGEDIQLRRVGDESEGLRARGKQRRRQRILEAARELLHEDPSQGLTVPRIAERAEVSPATVFNLVGPRERIWTALADHALGAVDYGSLPSTDPHARARAIMAEVARVVCADAAVFRALIVGWNETGQAMAHDPTSELTDCLRSAAREGLILADVDFHRLAQLLSAGLIGTVHQWAAGVISDRALRTRLRDLVDVTFAAARPSSTTHPDWNLNARRQMPPALRKENSA
jgi:AcrR family transcriptional regulator